MKNINISTLVVCALLCLGYAERAQAQGNWVPGNAVMSNVVTCDGGSLIASGTKGTASLTLSGTASGNVSATFTVPVTWSNGAAPAMPPVYSIKIPCSGDGNVTTTGNVSSHASADNPVYSMGGGCSSNSYTFSFASPYPYTSSSAGTYAFYLNATVQSRYGAMAEATATLTLTQ